MTTTAPSRDVPVGMALPGLVIAFGMIGDGLLYAVLPLYHQDFGLSLGMVGVLLSLNRWIRLFANSAVAHLGERLGPHALMIAAAIGSVISTALYGLAASTGVQIAARMLWGISFAGLNLATLAYAVSDRANAGKRVGLSRAAIGVVQALSLVGGAWMVLQVGARSTFVILGGVTLVAFAAALALPRLPPEPASTRGFRLPVPHRLEVWGFMLGFAGDGVFLLTLAFLMKDSITSVEPVLATAMLLALRWLVEITTGPVGGWVGDRFGARRAAIVNGVVLVAGFGMIAAGYEVAGALLTVMTRGMFNTLVPVLVIARGKGGVLSSQASYSTWRDFGAAVGPLTAPWLFLHIPQTPLYAALALALGVSAWACLVRR
ncbi:MFS transporter [Reyranella sp.]|jgi:MFS family permease|uniref:MFS transporter n=1 Tax=Reyranella sp. TaxID=1929291 RepID=UPI002F9371D5